MPGGYTPLPMNRSSELWDSLNTPFIKQESSLHSENFLLDFDHHLYDIFGVMLAGIFIQQSKIGFYNACAVVRRIRPAMTFVILFPILAAPVLLSGCATGKVPSGPPLERVSRWYETPDYSWGSATELKEWVNTETPTITANNPENRWPNGMAASMTPFIVDWMRSSWDLNDHKVDTNAYAIVKNVYVGGNPILGQVQLSTIRIPEGGVKKVEFIIVRYALKGIAKTGGHVQLRFVFEENKRPELLNSDGSRNAESPYLDDLIISWEAWRPTQQKWSFKDGLNMDNYRLSARMYAGNQRFLQDLLRGAVWDCYPLDLSLTESMGDTILASGLLLGDGLARKLIWSILEEGLIIQPSGEVQATWEKQDKNLARRMLAMEAIPDSPIKPYIEELDPGYHAVQRSCINASLKQIDLAMEYLYQDQALGPWPGINVSPEKIPSWFDDVVEGNGWGTFYHAPYALLWIMGHKEIMPYKAYIPLMKAGLLELNKKGRPVFYRYGKKYSSPYGPLKDRIM